MASADGMTGETVRRLAGRNLIVMRKRRRRTATALGISLFALVGTALTAGAGPAAGATVSNWMITSHAISLINGYTGNGTLTTGAFDVASTAEIGTVPHGWVAQRTASYTLYGPVSNSSSFLYALKYGKVPAGTVYVLLDLESWALTPHPEQVTPQVYLREFVSTADKYGYKAILAPSISLRPE